MAKIPWIMWIIVGGVMYYVSYRVGPQLDIFSYIGVAFVAIGIFKMLVSFILGGKEKKARKEAEEIREQEFTCPRCRYAVASDYTFCPHCGTRLR